MKNNKQKDIAESVLPATRNAAQRVRGEFADIKRASRRRVRQKMGQVRSVSDYENSPNNFREHVDHKVRQVMWERRESDNLGALIRWAQTIAKRDLAGMDDVDQYMFFKDVLGNTMQGRHALQHVEMALNLRPDPFYLGWFARIGYNTEEARKLRAHKDQELRSHLRQNLIRILEEGRHKDLNKALKLATHPLGHPTKEIDHVSPWGTNIYKYAPCSDCKYRIFTGLGQIEEFIDYLMRNSAHVSTRFGRYNGWKHNAAFDVVHKYFQVSTRLT